MNSAANLRGYNVPKKKQSPVSGEDQGLKLRKLTCCSRGQRGSAEWARNRAAAEDGKGPVLVCLGCHMKHHTLGGLIEWKFLTFLEAEKSKMKVTARCISL